MIIKKYKFPSKFKVVYGDDYDFELNGKKIKVGTFDANRYLTDLESLKKYAPYFLKYLETQGEDISDVTVSIPAKTYFSALIKKQKGIPNYLNEFKKHIQDCLPEVKKISFLPQGVSSLFYYLNDGTVKNGDIVLTIDGGFNTLNISVTAIENNALVPIFNESLFDMGIRHLLEDYFKPILLNSFEEYSDKINTDWQSLKDIFLKNKLTIGANEFNIVNEKKEAVTAYIEELLENIMIALKPLQNIDYNVINIVGGLSYYLNDSNLDTNKKLIVPKESGEFLTAMGMATRKHDLACDIGFGDVKIAKIIEED